MKQIAKVLTITFFIGFVLSSCKKDKAIQQEVNKPPVANAGFERVIILPEDRVVLSGSGTDADGYIISYEWRYVSGPSSFTFINAASATATVKDMVRGIYEFELKVTDNSMLFHTDRVDVLVLDS
ncbi:MAG: hypothetical protein ABIP79_13945 [Chitinophagaceae bacterium]